MISFFKRIPLGIKLLLISIIPLLLIVFLAYQLHFERQKQVNVIVAYTEKIKRNTKIVKLIEDLQNERKLSYDLLLNKGRENELSLQRKETDSILNILKATADPQILEFHKYTNLESLDSIRTGVNNKTMDNDQVTNFYSSLIFRLNTLTATSVPVNPVLKPLYNELQAQRILSEMITYLSIIRANFYTILDTREYEVQILMGTHGAFDVLQSYEKEFYVKAKGDALDDYDSIKENSDYAVFMNYLKRSFENFKVDNTYTSAEYWNISELGLDQLAMLQNHIGNKSILSMEKIKAEQIRKKNLGLALVITLMILVMAVVLTTILILSGMLREIKLGAEQLALGLSGIRIKKWSDDAVGSLAQSIAKIGENQNKLANAADEIGKGHFNVDVQPRSKADVLGNSIVSMQASLQKFSSEMEDLVKERTEQLEQSNLDLQQFAHVASHDLKEPLRKIMIFSNLLYDKMKDKLPAKELDYVKKINLSAKRLSGMVDGVLKYSIINANEEELMMVNLKEIVENVLLDLEMVIEQKNINVEVGDLPIVPGTATLLHQLIYNLVSNAIKFSKETGQAKISISSNIVHVKDLPADFNVNGSEYYHDIRVQDNGIGFKQQYAESLFNIFSRLNSKEKYEGTGLGLTLCRKIAQRHNGEILAEGTEGEGACFRILLPVTGKPTLKTID